MEGLGFNVDVNTIFRQAWDAGKIIIIGTLSEGPDAGKEVVCIAKRHEVRDGIRRAKRLFEKDPGFLESVRRTLRRQALKGLSGLAPGRDGDFMGDLAIMMSVKIAAQDEHVLDGSGLFSLMIAVNPDETAPWTKRGLLSKDVPDSFVEIG